jgi:RNA polymerase sigma-70 factor (ECF subfamily)
VDGPLEESLRDAWEAGRAAWPDVELAEERFVAYVRERLAPDATAAAVVSLKGTDLYLACACAHRARGALERFDRVLMSRVPGFVRRIDETRTFADEVCQTLWEKLFVASETGPKIATYDGEASLLAWLHVVAVRAAINLAAARQPDRFYALDDAAATALEDHDPELDFLKAQYRDEFQAAVRAAIGELSTQHRRVLRMHLSAGLSTPQIGAILRVHHTTVVRQLAAAREEIRTNVRARLQAQFGLDSAEFDSISGLLLSRLDLSIDACLRESHADSDEGR